MWILLIVLLIFCVLYSQKKSTQVTSADVNYLNTSHGQSALRFLEFYAQLPKTYGTQIIMTPQYMGVRIYDGGYFAIPVRTYLDSGFEDIFFENDCTQKILGGNTGIQKFQELSLYLRFKNGDTDFECPIIAMPLHTSAPLLELDKYAKALIYEYKHIYQKDVEILVFSDF